MSDQTDLKVHPDIEFEEEPRPLISGRRLVRWITVLAVGILAVLALWQDPLYALH